MKSAIKAFIRILGVPFVIGDYLAFKKKDDKRFSIRLSDFYPQIKDKTITTGFDRHYVYHTAWALRVVKEIVETTKIAKHIDISSSLYFCTHLSAWVPTEFYDYRPAKLAGLNGLTSLAGDLLNLPFENDSVTSLSCMHTIEHIGMGRYGEPIDPMGDLKAIKELIRVVTPGGSLLFVTPIGGEARIEWNAHRIYTYEQIISNFPGMTLKEFAFIPEKEDSINPDQSGIVRNADPKITKDEKYGCGCFWFVKK